MKNKTKVFLGSSLILVSALCAVGTASAQSVSPTPAKGWGGGGKGMGMMMHRAPGVFGTVSVVNGNTITVTSKGFGRNASTTPATTYTVDATNATITKAGVASSITSIGVGDMVDVLGTVSGTEVTATAIHDGIMPGRGMQPKTPGQGGGGPVIQGNGQPVIGGSITAVSGSTLTVTNKSNVTYTVDATNATVTKGHATSTVSSIVVGDNVIVQGAVNGNAVTASSVIDQANPPSSSTTSGGVRGLFGNIGGFFKHMFGFF
jgi:hypothetical protein